jgi:hypothetical protein
VPQRPPATGSSRSGSILREAARPKPLLAVVLPFTARQALWTARPRAAAVCQTKLDPSLLQVVYNILYNACPAIFRAPALPPSAAGAADGTRARGQPAATLDYHRAAE